jgi:hypothetical protein
MAWTSAGIAAGQHRTSVALLNQHRRSFDQTGSLSQEM